MDKFRKVLLSPYLYMGEDCNFLGGLKVLATVAKGLLII